MDSVARSRQRVLALFLPVSVALLMIGEALTPKGLDQAIMKTSTALEMLPIAAKHPTQLYVSNALVIVGLGALAVSFAAIATLVRGRGSTFATVAALIGGFASFCGAIINVLVGFNLAAAVKAQLAQEDAARFLVVTFKSGVGNMFILGYFFGLIVASILMVIALWRSRCVPRWLPILFAVSLQVALFAHAGIVSIPLMLPFAVAMVILASRIWQAAALPAGDNPEPNDAPT